MPIFSLQVEKHSIGGLIRHPFIFADVAPMVSENIYFNEVHSVLFCVIRDSILKQEQVDKVLIAKKIKDLGISFKDEIDIYEYVDSISYTQITPEATIEAFKELVTLKIRRDIYENATKIQKEAKSNLTASIDELITNCDSIYNKNILALALSDEPQNLFENIDTFIEERGNDNVEENGFLTPYANFNKLYGGLRNRNLYAFVSRPGGSKSTVLADLCFKASLASKFKIKTLYLDTEMETEDIKWRMVSSITGVPMWYLETGNWRKNAEMVKTVRAALQLCKNYQYDHLKVGNKTVDQVCSQARRWYYSKVGRGNPAIVVYDYIKMTGEKLGESWKEYQAIGDKVDKIKKLAEEIDCPILTAMQMNRSGENFNKKSADVADDSSAIATSDRMQWFASYVGIFRKKVIEEIAEDGLKFGSHKLITLKTRFQGKEAPGNHDLIKRKFKDGSERYVNNYLSFGVENFNVTEKGTVRDIIEENNKEMDTKEDNTQDGDSDL